MNDLNALIGKCVRKNIRFPGALNTSYTVQNFFDGSVTMKTIKEIAYKLNERLQKMKRQDLFGEDAAGSTEAKTLDLQVETLKEVYTYKKVMAERAEKAAKTREENRAKLDMLRKVKATKEIGSLEKKSITKLDEMIEELEGALSPNKFTQF